jgi:uncharacterized protein YejL (UPF0352 family)
MSLGHGSGYNKLLILLNMEMNIIKTQVTSSKEQNIAKKLYI